MPGPVLRHDPAPVPDRGGGTGVIAVRIAAVAAERGRTGAVAEALTPSGDSAGALAWCSHAPRADGAGSAGRVVPSRRGDVPPTG